MKTTTSRLTNNRCAFCHDSSGVLGMCDGCGAAHHTECFHENRGKCAACYHRNVPTTVVEQFTKPATGEGMSRDEAEKLVADYFNVYREAQERRNRSQNQNVIVYNAPPATYSTQVEAPVANHADAMAVLFCLISCGFLIMCALW